MSGRKTPIKKSVEIDKYELKALLVALPMLLLSNNEDEEVVNTGANIYSRLLQFQSDWEDEAYQNGEFF